MWFSILSIRRASRQILFREQRGKPTITPCEGSNHFLYVDLVALMGIETDSCRPRWSDPAVTS